MYRILGLSLILSTSTIPISSAFAQQPVDETVVEAKKASPCEQLHRQWDDVERKLSILNSEDTGDTSAVRAQMRSSLRSEQLQRGQFLFNQMVTLECSDLPVGPPRDDRYTFHDAIKKCEDALVVAKLVRNAEISRVPCNKANWEPDTDDSEEVAAER